MRKLRNSVFVILFKTKSRNYCLILKYIFHERILHNLSLNVITMNKISNIISLLQNLLVRQKYLINAISSKQESSYRTESSRI